MVQNFTELAFTASVKAEQEQHQSRKSYERMEQRGEFRTALTWLERSFIAERDSFYAASVGENGWPYVQFRGGPRGFLKVLDEKTLVYADFRGNGQYISTGNWKAMGKSCLFLMDYVEQQRLKIWVNVDVRDAAAEPGLLDLVEDPGRFWVLGEVHHRSDGSVGHAALEDAVLRQRAPLPVLEQ